MSEKNPIASKLRGKHCRPLKSGSHALTPSRVKALLVALSGWKLDSNQISKTYTFENYYQTMAFVNALAWISHREDHHPDLEVGYNRCTVHYSTHSVNGLSENDFICAAKADALLKM